MNNYYNALQGKLNLNIINEQIKLNNNEKTTYIMFDGKYCTIDYCRDPLKMSKSKKMILLATSTIITPTELKIICNDRLVGTEKYDIYYKIDLIKDILISEPNNIKDIVIYSHWERTVEPIINNIDDIYNNFTFSYGKYKGLSFYEAYLEDIQNTDRTYSYLKYMRKIQGNTYIDGKYKADYNFMNIYDFISNYSGVNEQYLKIQEDLEIYNDTYKEEIENLTNEAYKIIESNLPIIKDFLKKEIL